MDQLWIVVSGVVGLMVGMFLGERVGYATGRSAHLMDADLKEREGHGEPMKGAPVDHHRPVWDEEAKRHYDAEIARTAFACDAEELRRAAAEFGQPATAGDRPVRHTPRRQR